MVWNGKRGSTHSEAKAIIITIKLAHMTIVISIIAVQITGVTLIILSLEGFCSALDWKMFYKLSVEILHQFLFRFLGFFLSTATCAHGKVFGFLHAVPSTWPPRCTAGVVADGAYWSWDRTIASPIYITWTIGGTFLKPTGHLQLLWLVETGRLSCFEMASCQFWEPPSVCLLSHFF